jgi:hypothetical protein
MQDSERKDPRRVAAGRAGMRARWAGHVPRVISLDTLTAPQRRLVLALVNAARDEAAREPGSGPTADEAA